MIQTDPDQVLTSGNLLPFDPAKIMVAGDWHGNAGWATYAVQYAQAHGVDTIVHTGDFGWWVPGDRDDYLSKLQEVAEACGITIVWVRGNHEFQPEIDQNDEECEGEPWADERYPNIIHAPNGYRWTWWGFTWLALGGAHSIDKQMRKPGLSWWDSEHITDAHMERAVEGGEVDMMICHDCPMGVEIPGISTDPELDSIKSGWPRKEIAASNEHRQRLREVCDVVKPKYLFHGHYHRQHFNQLRYEDGGVTNIIGLDCDGTIIGLNTMIINKGIANDEPTESDPVE